MLRLIFAWLGASLTAIVVESVLLSYAVVQVAQSVRQTGAKVEAPLPTMPELIVRMLIYFAPYVLPVMLGLILLAARISSAAPKYHFAIFAVAGGLTMSAVIAIDALMLGNDLYFHPATTLIGMTAGLVGSWIWRPGPSAPNAPQE